MKKGWDIFWYGIAIAMVFVVLFVKTGNLKQTGGQQAAEILAAAGGGVGSVINSAEGNG